ncbi:hypothetical protein D9M69_479290 [compost metagenome]
MFELITDTRLLLGEIVEAGVATIGRDRADRLAVRPVAVEIAPGATGRRIHVFAEQRELGALVRLPGEGGRDEQTIVLDRLDFGAPVTRKAGHAIEHRAFVIERPGNIEGALHPTVGAVLDFDFAQRIAGRPLRNDVDDAAGAAGAVDGGRRAAQDGDRLDAIGLQPEEAVRARNLAQAVAEDAGQRQVDAADLEGVEARFGAVLANAGAGRIVQRLLQVLRLQVLQLLLADHRHRLRRLHDRRIGLGGDARRFRDITVGLDNTLSTGPLTGRGDFFELCRAILDDGAGGDRCIRRIEDLHGLLTDEAIAKAGSFQKRCNGRFRRQRAADAAGGLSARQRARIKKAQVGLLAKFQDARFEGSRGNGERLRRNDRGQCRCRLCLDCRRAGDERNAGKRQACERMAS